MLGPGRWLMVGVLAGLLGWLARPRAPLPAGRPATTPVRPRRLLAIKLADIGDALGVEPALAALRAALPEATIEALVTPGARQALVGCPHLDGLIDFDKQLFDRPRGLLRPANLLAAARFLWQLRQRHYEAVVLFHHLPTRWGALKFRLVGWVLGAPIRAGLDNGRGDFLTHTAPDLGFGARPEWRYWLEVVAALGLPVVERAPVFPVGPADLAAAEAVLAETPRGDGPLVAIHPGVGGYAPLKQWPVERFAAVARRLIETAGATVLVVGGPGETALGAALTDQIGPGAVNLAGRTSLPALAALLSRCDLLLGNDSGVAHLASAVGCRTLALFGPTNAAAWAPAGAAVVTLPVPVGSGQWAVGSGQWAVHSCGSGPRLSANDTDHGELRTANREPPTAHCPLPTAHSSGPVAGGARSVALRVDEPCSPCYYAGFTVRARGHCPHRNCLQHLTPAMVAGVAAELLAAP